MAKSVSYAVSSRETNIIQRAWRPEGWYWSRVIRGRGTIKGRGMKKGRHLALYQIFKTTVFTTKYMINIYIYLYVCGIHLLCVVDAIFFLIISLLNFVRRLLSKIIKLIPCVTLFQIGWNGRTYQLLFVLPQTKWI
jgi:hypothetical protein